MPKTNLGSVSVDALLKLRDDVSRLLSQKAAQLRDRDLDRVIFVIAKVGSGFRRSRARRDVTLCQIGKCSRDVPWRNSTSLGTISDLARSCSQLTSSLRFHHDTKVVLNISK
jgi:hypothetical protein